MAGVSLADATKEVARRDRVLAKAIARLGPLEHSPRDPDGPFAALALAIVYLCAVCAWRAVTQVLRAHQCDRSSWFHDWSS